MNQSAAASEPTKSIVVEYDLPQAPALVWRVLTESDLLAKWLMPNDIRPEVGHNFTFRTKPMPGFDGMVYCQILEVDVQRRLSYSWRGGANGISGPEPFLDSVVTWTLTPKDDGGTHLRLDHDGFTANDSFAYEGLGHGWRGGVADSLRRVLDSI